MTRRTSKPKRKIDPQVPAERRAEQDAFNKVMGARTREKVLRSNVKRAADLPADVYMAVDADGRVLYVGQTTRFEARMAQHRSRSGWWPEHAQITRNRCESVAEALTMEYELIEKHRPEWNELYEDDRHGQGY